MIELIILLLSIGVYIVGIYSYYAIDHYFNTYTRSTHGWEIMSDEDWSRGRALFWPLATIGHIIELTARSLTKCLLVPFDWIREELSDGQ